MAKFVILVAGATLLMGAAAAQAQPSEFAERVMNTCRPDAERVCAGVQPGEGRIARCLLDHERDLKPSCLRGIKLAYAIEVCMPEYKRLCSSVPQGPAAVECLAQRRETLPQDCRRVLAASEPFLGGQPDRYGYNREAGPYGGPYQGPYARPYGDSPRPYAYGGPPSPYGAPPSAYPYGGRPGPYSNREPPRDDEAYLGEDDRNPYQAPNSDRPPSDGRYADRDSDRYRDQGPGEPPDGEEPYESAPYGEGPRRDRFYSYDSPLFGGPGR
jgi:cysteine rich repeat protein